MEFDYAVFGPVQQGLKQHLAQTSDVEFDFLVALEKTVRGRPKKDVTGNVQRQKLFMRSKKFEFKGTPCMISVINTYEPNGVISMKSYAVAHGPKEVYSTIFFNDSERDDDEEDDFGLALEIVRYISDARGTGAGTEIGSSVDDNGYCFTKIV